MSDPNHTVRGANRPRDPQDEIGFSSWMIVGVLTVAVIGLAFTTLTGPGPNPSVVANRSIPAPMVSAPTLFEDETTGQGNK